MNDINLICLGGCGKMVSRYFMDDNYHCHYCTGKYESPEARRKRNELIVERLDERIEYFNELDNFPSDSDKVYAYGIMKELLYIRFKLKPCSHCNGKGSYGGDDVCPKCLGSGTEEVENE